MSHFFETGFFGGNQEAWHGFGNVIEADVLTREDALRESGLDWQVSQRPIYTKVGDEETGFSDILLPQYVANIRDTDNKLLGVVGKDYKVVQNSDAFEFVDTLVASGDAKYHTAGSLKEGRRVWMLARVNRDILIGGEESERIAPFILLTNGHDGFMGVFVAVTPIRVVCWNTLSFALASAKRVWSTRHTKKVHDRMELATEAAETLGLTYKFFDRIEEAGNALILDKITEKQVENFLTKLIPNPKDAEEGSRTVRTRQEDRDRIFNIYRNEENLANIRGTKWGVFQAVTQFHDHLKPVRLSSSLDEDVRESAEVERRFDRSVYDVKFKNVAMALLAPEWVSNPKKVLKDRDTVSETALV